MEDLTERGWVGETLELWDTSACIVATVWDWVDRITALHHTVPAKKIIYEKGNRDDLKTSDGLRNSLNKLWNYLFETSSWFCCTTPWPYSSTHLMIIYKKDPLITNLEDLPEDERKELFLLLKHLTLKLSETYTEDIQSWDYELLLWFNHSISAWWWAVKSLDRLHIHVFVIRTNEWEHNGIVTKSINVCWIDIDEDNRWMLALNEQNLCLMRDFERYIAMSDLWRNIKRDIVIPWTDDNYTIDIEWPNQDIFSQEWQEMTESAHRNLYSFIAAVENRKEGIVSRDTLTAIDNSNPPKNFVNNTKGLIGYTISYLEIDWKWHMRIRFSFKNHWENSWVVESRNHAIFKDTKQDVDLDQSTAQWFVRWFFRWDDLKSIAWDFNS